MKKILLIFIICISFLPVIANPVQFKLSVRSIKNSDLKSMMEDDISVLLSEINQAAVKKSQLDLTNINMEDEAKRRLMSQWDESVHFMCE